MGVQSEQEVAERATLGCCGVQHNSGGYVTANLDFLWSVYEEVQYPGAKCHTQA